MAEVGRDLWRSSGPTLPAQSRVNHSWLLRTVSSQLFNISKEGDPTTSLGNLLQCSVCLTVKKRFLILKKNFLILQFVSTTSHLVTGQH